MGLFQKDAPEDEIRAAFKPNTKAVFGETLANPALAVFDIEKFAKIAHENGVPLIESYGASETSGAVSLDLVGETDLNCCGTVFENLDVVIDSPDSDGFGEILVRGDIITHGYLGCDCNSRYFDENGYYHTGDIGRLGDGRKLYFKGRIRRLLDTSSGKNIYADELEKMIADLGVCSKVRVSLENKMITAKIYTELTKAEVSAVIDEMNSRLPKYKRIQDICFCRDEMGMRIK